MNYYIIGGIVIVVILVILYIRDYNKFNVMKEQIEQEKSGIDVALTTRYDTVTQMQNVIKGVMKHESETLVKVNAVRNGMSIDEMNEAEKQMGQAVRQFYAVAESNPQLRASENFTILQRAISECEDNLQAARRAYNASVGKFNKSISVFPNNIVSGNMKLEKAKFFEADEQKRELVDIQF